jgi:hypothetical protein
MVNLEVRDGVSLELVLDTGTAFSTLSDAASLRLRDAGALVETGGHLFWAVRFTTSTE